MAGDFDPGRLGPGELRKGAGRKPRRDLLAAVAAALPPEIQFYHLGIVRQDRASRYAIAGASARSITLGARERHAIGIPLSGELGGALLLFVDKKHDLSVYCELANVLAGRLATAMSAAGVEVLVSHPRALPTDPLYLGTLLGPNASLVHRKYSHETGGKSVALDVVVLAGAGLQAMG